ncbi:MAG: hypothetical protein AAFR51_06070 [Pseudomonadota bacterium]
MTKIGKEKAMLAIATALLMSPAALSEASIFELRITNDSEKDLTFRLQDGHSKHARLTYDKKQVSSHTIKAGTYGVVGVQPTGAKCDPKCGVCTPTYGKVFAWYTNDKGEQVRNNYYKATVEFFEYCGVAATKPVTTYTSNWAFDHGGGQGTNNITHTQKATHNNYTKSSPAQGLTVDGNHISGHATITYSN